MPASEKMTGKERQAYILSELKQAKKPIKGSEFAKIANVSRQVIVQDVSLLKAKDEPILATNQGYIYMKDEAEQSEAKRIIAVNHKPEQTLEELNTIVDHGVTVRDVRVEHAVYGDLTATVNVSNRQEVKLFVENMEQNDASLLSELTDGVHLHTLEANDHAKIDAACKVLKEAGILVED